MIRKAFNLGPTAMDPTPDEIRRRSEAIRKAWTPRERARRTGTKRVGWTPPVFAETDFAGFGGGEVEAR
jgi:hypothetical protein